jgi:hypothetical protein
LRAAQKQQLALTLVAAPGYSAAWRAAAGGSCAPKPAEGRLCEARSTKLQAPLWGPKPRPQSVCLRHLVGSQPAHPPAHHQLAAATRGSQAALLRQRQQRQGQRSWGSKHVYRCKPRRAAQLGAAWPVQTGPMRKRCFAAVACLSQAVKHPGGSGFIPRNGPKAANLLISLNKTIHCAVTRGSKRRDANKTRRKMQTRAAAAADGAAPAPATRPRKRRLLERIRCLSSRAAGRTEARVSSSSCQLSSAKQHESSLVVACLQLNRCIIHPKTTYSRVLAPAGPWS